MFSLVSVKTSAPRYDVNMTAGRTTARSSHKSGTIESCWFLAQWASICVEQLLQNFPVDSDLHSKDHVKQNYSIVVWPGVNLISDAVET